MKKQWPPGFGENQEMKIRLNCQKVADRQEIGNGKLQTVVGISPSCDRVVLGQTS